MTLISRTLSSEFREFIKPGDTESELLERLKKDPLKLLRFFQQSTQSIPWVSHHKLFVLSLVICIKDFALSQVLSWDVVLKVATVYKYQCGCSIAITKPDLEFTDCNFSSLVLMANCKKLREKWIGNPSYVPTKKDLLTQVTGEQAQTLYLTMLTRDYSRLSNESTDTLQLLIFQSIEWGYSMGIQEIQKVICDQIHDLSSVFGIYVFANTYDLPILRMHCLIRFNEFEYYVNEIGPICIIHYSLFLEIQKERGILGLLTDKDLKERSKSFFSTDLKTHYTTAIVRKFEFTFLDSKLSMVRIGHKILDMTEADDCKREMASLQRVNLNSDKIKRVIFDGKNKLTDITYAGMLLYFTECEYVEFDSYKEVTDGFLRLISSVVPSLKVLSFLNSNVSDEVLLNVPEKFTDLKMLNLSHTRVSSKVIQRFSRCNIEALSFTFSNIELPVDISGLSNLRGLVLQGIQSLSRDEILRLLKITTKLETFSGVETQNFYLDEFPHPEHLLELAIHCDQMNDLILKEKMGVLDPFQKLKSVALVGSPSSKLKIFILDQMRKRPNVAFKFLPTRKKD